MNVVTRSQLLGSSLDFITEHALTDDERIIDTRGWLDVGYPFYLNGPKYVSESTVRSLAKALGCELVPTEDAEAVRKIVASVNHLGDTSAANNEAGSPNPSTEPTPKRSTSKSTKLALGEDLS